MREDGIRELLNKDLQPSEPGRLDSGLVRARREVALRDVMTLTLARLWVALSGLLAPVICGVARALQHTESAAAGDGVSPNEKRPNARGSGIKRQHEGKRDG